jgi:lysophospholipid acyltransferase (LPLAT)-like uncharacterized protein
MRTARTAPKSSVYIDHDDAESLRDLAADLGLHQVSGGGARYQAGSLSALLRFLATASRTRHRGAMLEFLRALAQVTAVPRT